MPMSPQNVAKGGAESRFVFIVFYPLMLNLIFSRNPLHVSLMNFRV